CSSMKSKKAAPKKAAHHKGGHKAAAKHK
ncbi:MAG: hypothetical protein ACJAU5_000313, partial [Maricaulis maris]